MYKHQEDCGNQIVQLETQQNFKMDYVINTREDIFFFKPLDLNSLIAKHMTARSSNSSGVAEDDTQALQTVTPEPPCDLITKGCLDFGGLNMRLQVIRRDPRGAALMAKVSYFKQMLQRPKRTFENPEMFEQYIAENLLQMKVCKLAVEELPVTAARLSYVNLSVCFIHQVYTAGSYTYYTPLTYSGISVNVPGIAVVKNIIMLLAFCFNVSACVCVCIVWDGTYTGIEAAQAFEEPSVCAEIGDGLRDHAPVSQVRTEPGEASGPYTWLRALSSPVHGHE